MLSINVASINKNLLLLSHLNVLVNHHLDKLLKPNLGLPTKHLLGLGSVPFEVIDLGGAKVPLVNDDMVPPIESHIAERDFQELLHGVGLFSGHNIVIGLLLLQHQPHGFNVVPSEAPISGGLEVAQEELALEPDLDAAHGPRDLAGHEILAAAGGLVVEEDAVAGEEGVSLAVVHGVPVGGAFGGGVGGAGVEGGGFGLRRRGGAEHLGGAGLVVADVGAAGGGDVGADGLEEAEGAGGDDVGGVVGYLEGDGDVRLSGEVVDLVGEDGVEPAAEGGGVGEIGVVELHAGLVGVVGIHVYVVDALRVEVRRAADQAVHLVPLVQEEFRQVRTVLSGNSGYQCHLARRSQHPVRRRSGSLGVLH